MIKTALFAAAALMTVAAAPAFAADVAVTYKDLDLATGQGQETLARRLDKAARSACGMDSARTGTRMPSREATQCYKDAQVRAKDSLAAIVAKSQKGG